MPSRRTPAVLFVKRSVWLAAAAAVLGASVVSAQPPSPPLPPTPLPPQSPAAPTGPSEEPPPINVPTPAPLAVPPISEKEVTAAPAPAEEPKPAAPVRRARYDVAVLEALDKVTAESLRFEAAVGRPVRYKSLVFTVKACERSAPDEPIDDSIAYVTVDSQPRPEPGKPALAPRQTYKGWMFASSPGLHPLEHPVYDAWLITCRAAAPPSAPAR